MNIYGDITQLKGVGAKRKEEMNRAGIFTVSDLLTFFPRAYEDHTRIYSIKDAPLNMNVCVRAYAGSVVREQYIRKGMTLYKLDATDGESMMDITFFNNKYAAKALKTGTEYIFFGKVTTFGRGYRQMTSPQFSEADASAKGLMPVYPQTFGISSRAISAMVRSALDGCGAIEDCLPESVRNDYCLMSKGECLENLHFPKSPDLLEEAKRRYAFEELFTLQIGLSRLKIKARHRSSSKITGDFTAEFISSLPFTLTNAQSRAVGECVSDMLSGVTMNRMIQGDVGSGKTAVAAAVIYNCVKNGYQAALMAPTEVLAQQHYKTFTSFYKNHGIEVELLTGSTSAKEKRRIKDSLLSGKTGLVIGTHALIQKDVEFRNLALAITDEQHRFGVSQRAMLNSKGESPHVLVMSATPIPRTLSFIVFGELDLSILDEMPAGRQKTDTFLIDNEIRERAYGYVKKHLDAGRQGYIVCPLVEDEEDPDSGMKASKQLYKDLSNGFFKGYRLGLLYGKMKSAEKKAVMESFAAGETDLLISTTVIEVGVDVPNAVIMVIENAEMFGLSQLHQLRGRVGRGSEKSTCILISNSTDAERLKILTKTNDGFKIADEDLRLRGPGDIFGSRQHGLPNMKIANMITDGEIVRETHTAAENLLRKDPALSGSEFEPLRNNVNRLFAKGISMN